MLQFVRAYIRGLFDSINSIQLFLKVIETKKTKNVLNMLIIYNIYICLSVNFLLNQYCRYFNNHYLPNQNILYTNSLAFILKALFWVIPNYILGLLYNSYYTNKSIAVFIEEYNPQNINLKYKCYEKYSTYLVNKGYYQIIVMFLTLETIVISFIPYLGTLLDWLLTSLIYSYYCWEFSWSSYKIPHINRYSIFENNWLYYLGYGSIIGYIKIKVGFLNATYIIASIFPIFSMNALLLFKYDKQSTNPVKLKLPLFYLPIKYSNYIINTIVNYLKNPKS